MPRYSRVATAAANQEPAQERVQERQFSGNIVDPFSMTAVNDSEGSVQGEGQLIVSSRGHK